MTFCQFVTGRARDSRISVRRAGWWRMRAYSAGAERTECQPFRRFASIGMRRGGRLAHGAGLCVGGKAGCPAFCHSVFVCGSLPISRKMMPGAVRNSFFRTKSRGFAAYFFRLCGKKKISFSKDGNFFPQRNRDFGGEMSVWSSSGGCFLTFAPLDWNFWMQDKLRIPGKSLHFERSSPESVTFCISGKRGYGCVAVAVGWLDLSKYILYFSCYGSFFPFVFYIFASKCLAYGNNRTPGLSRSHRLAFG